MKIASVFRTRWAKHAPKPAGKSMQVIWRDDTGGGRKRFASAMKERQGRDQTGEWKAVRRGWFLGGEPLREEVWELHEFAALDLGPQTVHVVAMKTQFFKIRADDDLALIVQEAVAQTGLGQSDIIRLGSLRGIPEVTAALALQNRGVRLPEAELQRRITALTWRARLSPVESRVARKRGRK